MIWAASTWTISRHLNNFPQASNVDTLYNAS